MTHIQQIPLDQLRISPRNARRTGGHNISDLAASIAAEGQLQNLVVTQAEDGLYEVEAGGRRLRAMQLLLTEGRLRPELRDGARCLVVGAEVANEASLAENTIREAMHPADQFDAFKALVDAGQTITDVAARFGVTELFVRQRLRLANVRPELFQLYRDGEMKLEQLQALATSTNHELQRQAWFSARQDWERQAHNLRDFLTREKVAADTPLAKFVGIDTYTAAGGAVDHDLFSTKQWLADPALLDKLAMDKLDVEAERLRAAGWSWVEAFVTLDYAKRAEFKQLDEPEGAPVLYADPAHASRLSQIESRIADIEEIDSDGLSEEEDKSLSDELSRLEEEREQIEDGAQLQWPESIKAVAGALVTVGSGGKLRVDLGRLRPGQNVTKSGTITGAPAGTSIGAPASKPAATKVDLSAAAELTLAGHRSEVIRAHLAADPHLALAVAVHAGLQMHRREFSGQLLGWRADSMQPAKSVSKSLSEPIQKRLQAADDSLKGYPTGGKLLPYLIALPTTKLQDILANLVALSFSSTSNSKETQRNADTLHAAIDFDMAEHWNVSCDDFISRAPRPVVVQAVTEAKGKDLGAKLDKLKKDERTAEATKLLAGTGWLPKPLRGPSYGKKPAKPLTTAAKPNKAPAKKAKPAKKSVAPAKKAVSKARPKKQATAVP